MKQFSILAIGAVLMCALMTACDGDSNSGVQGTLRPVPAEKISPPGGTVISSGNQATPAPKPTTATNK